MDYQKVVYADNGILVGLKKERKSVVCYNLGGLEDTMLREASRSEKTNVA